MLFATSAHVFKYLKSNSAGLLTTNYILYYPYIPCINWSGISGALLTELTN